MQLYEELEKEWGEFVGNPNTMVCSSGTSAVHLALESLQLPQGSEVILPDFTMIACARAVSMAGLKPVFVDCHRDNLLMQTELVSEAVTENTSAIMAVHIYGRQCNMDCIHLIAGLTRLLVVEDMAEIHGVNPHPKTDVACWSFYRNKIVAGEEGGAISFKNKKHLELARQLKSLGFTDAHDFSHIPRGINARLSNANAEPILRSIENYEYNNSQRREIEEWYNYYTPGEWQMPERDAVWVYDVRLPELDIVQDVVHDLNNLNVAARTAFRPMVHQPEYSNIVPTFGTDAVKASREIMYLPVYPGLTDGRVRDTVAALRESVILHTSTARVG